MNKSVVPVVRVVKCRIWSPNYFEFRRIYQYYYRNEKRTNINNTFWFLGTNINTFWFIGDKYQYILIFYHFPSQVAGMGPDKRLQLACLKTIFDIVGSLLKCATHDEPTIRYIAGIEKNQNVLIFVHKNQNVLIFVLFSARVRAQGEVRSCTDAPPTGPKQRCDYAGCPCSEQLPANRRARRS